ncbi:MAG: hypothetical protein ABSC53_13680 [Bacteroidota bacterium]|jgi:hypothetical protein
MEIEISKTSYEYDKLPDTCPLCHSGIEPRILIGNYIADATSMEGGRLQIILRCPRKECQNAFIASYWQSIYSNFQNGRYFLQSLAPYNVEPPNVPDEIKSVSKLFLKIYTQATTAEKFKLDQVAGAGYRKAIEFLIKDYCISINPQLSEDIKSKFLAKCIEDHVTDTNIKVCAKRATWLGNDETHYVRQWEEKDITDLKILIELTMGWIRNSILTEKYTKEME